MDFGRFDRGGPKTALGARLRQAGIDVQAGNRFQTEEFIKRHVNDMGIGADGQPVAKGGRTRSNNRPGRDEAKQIREAKKREANLKAEAKRQAAIAKANKGKPIPRGGKGR
jgi:RIO-like serine/threonine protein kinase